MKTRTASLSPLPPRPRFRAINLLTCAALLAAQLTLLPNSAQADITVTGQETGGNVVLSYSGNVDLTGFFPMFTIGAGNFIWPASGFFISNPTEPAVVDLYTMGPISSPFGAGPGTTATSSSGDCFAIASGAGQLAVPLGYISGASLAGTMTFDGATSTTPGSLLNR